VYVTHSSVSTKAGLSLSAIQQNESSGNGRFVNYNQLPDIVWNKLLPESFGVSTITNDMINNMIQVSRVYSKGRGSKANAVWKDDSAAKQSTAPKPIATAVDDYMTEIYIKLEELSN